MTEDELVERAARGDPLAIRTLYERYAGRVFAVSRRILGDDSLAEDSAQEAWVNALKGLPEFRGEARFGTWIHRIAVNAALQLRRHQGTRKEREEPIPEHLASPGRPRDVLLEERLGHALDQVPDRMRTVLILHDVEGYTHEEIGTLMDVQPGTSKSQLFKARARMREILRADGVADRDEGVEAWST
jgi:RNA polymerase sigma-70 factor, ECF subfamily